jgi:hypothetical protein
MGMSELRRWQLAERMMEREPNEREFHNQQWARHLFVACFR